MARRDPPPPMKGGSLGDLFKAKGLTATPGSERETRPVPEQPEGDAADLDALSKVVLRMQRKGHGGKTVTRVEGLTLSKEVLSRRAKELRKALGTGVRIDGEAFVVQGDQRERIEAWLTKVGVRRVVT